MKNTKNVEQLADRHYKGDKIFTTDQQLFANQSVGSDAYPYEILEIISERKIRVRRMKMTGNREAGHDWYSNQVWNIESDPLGKVVEVSRRKSGYWYQVNDGHYCPFRISTEPSGYEDPHF